MSEKLKPTPTEEELRSHIEQVIEARLSNEPILRKKINDFEEIYLELLVHSGMNFIAGPFQLREARERLAETKNEAGQQKMPPRQIQWSIVYGERLAESF